MLFTGTHQHTIDTKGRLSIPAEFRQALMRNNKQPPYLALDDGCLRLYRHNDYKKLMEPIIARGQFDSGRKKFSRRLFFNTTAAPIDSQGRILVPQFLREKAHLERDVVLGGAGMTIEIWNPQQLETVLNQAEDEIPDISTKMADDLGI